MDNTLKDYCDRSVIGTFDANIITASSDDRLKFNEKKYYKWIRSNKSIKSKNL